MAQIFASERSNPVQRAKMRAGQERQGPSSARLAALQRKADESVAQRIEEDELLQGKFDIAQRMEEEEPLQGKFDSHASKSVAQRNVSATTLPEGLRAGAEALSGQQLSDVRVHYNSSAPAQLNAHAYAQGNDIHLGPGQEKHLPHEAWHVVQQREGRVQPTAEVEGTAINDDALLEAEADQMGSEASKGPK